MVGGSITLSLHQLAIDPAYLAYPLGRYQQAERLSDKALAAELGITEERLDRLRLCKLPTVDPYAVRLYRLVEAFGVDVRAMTRILAAGR